MSQEYSDAIDFDSDFVQLVRSALAHLYDHAYLQNHPLISTLDLDVNPDHVTRAQGMRRLLLECIEMLRPEDHDHNQTDAARAYAILTYRYVDGLSMEEVAERLALSRRQVYREHGKGIRAIASLLWDRTYHEKEEQALPNQEERDQLQLIRAEVAHLQEAIHPEFLNLERVLEEVFKLLIPLTQHTDIQIKMSSPETWPSVVADRVILRQTLMNLLSYALHVARADLIVTATQGTQGLLIDICESASPPSREPPSLFPDHKANEQSLMVAQALLEVQGGYLQMEERDGKWCTRIVLPASDQKSVLVIDDNVDIVSLLRRYLGGHEVQVVSATDGEQALHLAGEIQPQAITLDVMMPNLDGWEILQRLKSSPDTQHIPIIICSVLNEPELALSMGADDYITKPVNQVKLLEVLRRWIGPLRPAA